MRFYLITNIPIYITLISRKSQDLDMHDLGGVLSWEAAESMLRVMSDLVVVAVLSGWSYHDVDCSRAKNIWISMDFQPPE